MALGALRCNHLEPLGFKGLKQKQLCLSIDRKYMYLLTLVCSVCFCDLDPKLMTLTYELDLDILILSYAKRSFYRSRLHKSWCTNRTDRQIRRRTNATERNTTLHTRVQISQRPSCNTIGIPASRDYDSSISKTRTRKRVRDCIITMRLFSAYCAAPRYESMRSLITVAIKYTFQTSYII